MSLKQRLNGCLELFNDGLKNHPWLTYGVLVVATGAAFAYATAQSKLRQEEIRSLKIKHSAEIASLVESNNSLAKDYNPLLEDFLKSCLERDLFQHKYQIMLTNNVVLYEKNLRTRIEYTLLLNDYVNFLREVVEQQRRQQGKLSTDKKTDENPIF